MQSRHSCRVSKAETTLGPAGSQCGALSPQGLISLEPKIEQFIPDGRSRPEDVGFEQEFGPHGIENALRRGGNPAQPTRVGPPASHSPAQPELPAEDPESGSQAGTVSFSFRLIRLPFSRPGIEGNPRYHITGGPQTQGVPGVPTDRRGRASESARGRASPYSPQALGFAGRSAELALFCTFSVCRRTRIKTNQTSAFIGVHQRPKMIFPSF